MPRLLGSRGHYDTMRARGALWTPQQLGAGLKCHLYGGDRAALTASGSEVTAIRERPLSPGLTWSRVTNGPSFAADAINRRPGLIFTSSPHQRIVSDTYVALTRPLVAVALFRMESAGNWYQRGLGWASSTGNDSSGLTGCAIMCRDYWDGGNGGDNVTTQQNGSRRASSALTFGTPNLVSVTIDGSGNIAHWINGVAGGTGTLSGTVDWSAVRFFVGCETIGGSDGGGFSALAGRGAEWIVYCGADALLQRQRIEGYAAWNNHHEARLAPAHRYRARPPLR